MCKLAVLFFLVAASCGTVTSTSNTNSENQTATDTKIQEGIIVLALGEATKVGDVTIQFNEVMEDSRCPTGIDCFWEGRARLLIETSEGGLTTDQSEIIFGALKEGETKNHTFYTSDEMTITATAINPYPTKESGTANLVYELVLEVKAN